MLGFRERGAVVFGYGNGVALPGGSPTEWREGESIPGVRRRLRPADTRPRGWPVPPGGLPHGRARGSAPPARTSSWTLSARTRSEAGSTSPASASPLQGLPARICWLGLGERDRVALDAEQRARPLGRMRAARAWPRPHGSCFGRLSQPRRRGARRQRRDCGLACALRAAQRGPGRELGRHRERRRSGGGRSIHSGMVVVADGSEVAERKIRRVFGATRRWASCAMRTPAMPRL